mgnify:FL=1
MISFLSAPEIPIDYSQFNDLPSITSGNPDERTYVNPEDDPNYVDPNANKSLLDFTQYQGNSVVEALKHQGVDSSFVNRQHIAANYGIDNYRGTAEQNARLLTYLRDEPGKLNETDPDTQVTDEPESTISIAAENDDDFQEFNQSAEFSDGIVQIDPESAGLTINGEPTTVVNNEKLVNNESADDVSDDEGDESWMDEPLDQQEIDQARFENMNPRKQKRVIRRNKRKAMRKQRRADRKEAWENRERGGHSMDLSYLKDTTKAFSGGLFENNNVKFNNKGLLGYL